MTFINCSPNQKIFESSVITVGSFDGVHLGHQALFQQMNHYAKQKNCKSVVITFNPHPQEILQNKPGFFLINSFDQVLLLFEKFKIDITYVIPFTKELSQKSAVEFFEEMVLSKINVKAVFMGPNHHFGRQREGDVHTLSKICQEKEIEIITTQEFKINEVEVRSTLIRKYLAKKDLENAKKLMGHNIWNFIA